MHLSIGLVRPNLNCAAKMLAAKIPTKKTAMKKVIPSAIIFAQSFGSFSGHAQALERALPTHELFIKSKYIGKFIPITPKPKKTNDPPVLRLEYAPNNNYSPKSECITEMYDGTAEELNYFIEKLIPKKHGRKDYNPFYQKGESFIRIGQEKGINPSVMVAISMLESGRGTSHAALKKNNIGGIDFNNERVKFDNVEECIEKIADVLKKRHDENYKSIEEIGLSGRYCHKDVSEVWVKNVMFFLNRM